MQEPAPFEFVGRFVTRPAGEGKPDIMVGVFTIDQTSIKQNTVYEIRSIAGVMVLREVGESWMQETHASPSWAHNICDIMQIAGNHLILTNEEIQRKNDDVQQD